MKLRIGRRVFAPTWVGSLLTVLVVPALISLGFWQLRRADEKRQLMAHVQQGYTQTFTLNAANAPTLPRYQRVTMQGSYDSAHQILLDNMPSSHGEPGYRVLTPLQLSDDSTVLVDRGWVSLGMSRRQLPEVSVTTQLREVMGVLDELPRPGVRAGNAGIQTNQWPQVLNYPTYVELQTLYGASLHSRIVLLDAQASDGFERIRQIDLGYPPMFGPERHVAYAVQWFGMAVTVLIIFLTINLKRIES